MLTWRVVQVGAWPASSTAGFVQLPTRDDFLGGGSGSSGGSAGGKGGRPEDPAEVKVPACP